MGCMISVLQKRDQIILSGRVAKIYGSFGLVAHLTQPH